MIYCISDLHGFSLKNFKAFLNKVGFGANDFLYVLGDVIDRGPDSVKLLNWLMFQPNMELLLGNHEAVLLACDFLFDEITPTTIENLSLSKLNAYRTWLANGGQSTVDALAATDKRDVRYLLDFVRQSPLYETLSVNGRDFVLVHGGLGNFSKNKKLREYTPTEILWTRPDANTRYFDDVTVIFGHTPTLCFGDEHRGRILKTDTWINIDVGVAAGFEPALLRLDDMKEIYYNDIM